MTTTSTAVRTLALIGVSHRSLNLYKELRRVLPGHFRVSALWDVDEKRFAAYAATFPDQPQPNAYVGNERLPDLLARERPDLVLVATMDCHHAACVIACLDAGIDVLVEKPMVTDCEQARAVLAAEARSSAKLHVAFNYRYQAENRLIKQQLDNHVIGRVTAVEMNIYLDEIHGSSFFQRWNRLRANSGGLSIHKEGHYLDLVTWWLQQKPVEVFCYGALNYYGPDGEMNPSRRDGRRCSTCAESERCAYEQVRTRKHPIDTHATGLQAPGARGRHRNVEWYSGYSPDRCIFDSEIDIEDTYSAVIRFDGGTFVTFSVNFSSPFEQHRVCFSGTRGRLEFGYPFAAEGSYHHNQRALVQYPLFVQHPTTIPFTPQPGGHGGGDAAMLKDLCDGSTASPSLATARDGAYAVAIGEAMWRSAKSGQPVRIADLLREWY